jgi:phosphate transport system substrate-binding protein
LKTYIKHLWSKVTVAVVSLALLFSLVPVAVTAGPNDLVIEGTLQCTDLIKPMTAAGGAFQTLFPAYNVQVVVPGASPTTTALTDIKNNAIDIAAAARALGPSDDAGHILTDRLIGREVICMIVGFQTNISQLTYAQIKGIYEGTITDWSQFGGQPLVPRARQVESGLHQTFCSSSWFAGTNVTLEAATITATGLPRLNSDAEMISTVASNPNQIGYIGMGSLLTAFNVKAINLSVAATTPNYVTPTLKNVYLGLYPQGRGLHLWYLTIDPEGKTAINDFVTFILSKAGQDALQAAGGVRVRPLQDVNGDGYVNIGDIVSIGLKWGATGASGWTREDINGDGFIDIGDVVSVGLWWGFAYTIAI